MPKDAYLVTKTAPGTVDGTVDRLLEKLHAAHVSVFAVIDQAAAAREAGLELRDTVMVVFGNPAAGTPLMVADPLVALDLPLRVVIWDDRGSTQVTYLDPAALVERYGLAPELVANLAVVHKLTDALAG